MRDPRLQLDDQAAGENVSSAMNSSTTFGGIGSKPSLNNALKRKIGMPKRSGDESFNLEEQQ